MYKNIKTVHPNKHNRNFMQNKNTITDSKKLQQIVSAGEKLFFQYGVKRTRVEEICRKANVSKMTFYKYFENKFALAEHIVQEILSEAWQKLDEVEAMPISFPEKLQMMQNYKLELTTRMGDDFIEEYLKMPILERERQRWLGRVMQFITSAQKRGDIRPEIRPEFILIMSDKIQELVEDPRIKSLYPSYIELTREVWDFFYYGIVTRKTEARS